MAMTRANLIAAVTGELAGVVTLAGFSASDTTGNMKEPADNTFRVLGATEEELVGAVVPARAEQAALAILSYFLIRKAVAATVSKMQVSAGGASAALREQHENLLRLQSQYLQIAQSFGFTVPGYGSNVIDPIPFVGGVDETDFTLESVPPLFSVRESTHGLGVRAWDEERWA